MTAQDFGNDATRDYLVVGSPGAVTTLSAYSLICLFKPSSALRSATIGVRDASSFKAQMIMDSGKWFGGGDFSAGYAGFTPVADHWIWAGLSHPAGSNVYRWHHRDVTAAGTTVHGDGTFAVGNPGAISTIRLGDGDNECRGMIAVGAVYGGVLSDSDFDTAFSLVAADAFGLGPLAMWLGDASDLATDVTGGGADVTSPFGTVVDGTDPPGFNYSLGATIDLVGAASIGGVSGAGALKRVVNMTGSMGVGGISASGILGARAVAGRRPIRASSTPRPIATIGRSGEQVTSSVERLA